MTKYIKYFITIIIFISLALNAYFFRTYFPSIKFKNPLIFQNKIIRVIDGDTFDLENGERIRLALINAPEYPKDCMGVDVKERLEVLVLNRIVSIEKLSKDNFGRIIALVYLDKLLVNEILVEEGFAYFDGRGVLNANSLKIEKTQEKAKLTGRGVWSSLCQTQKEGCLIKGNYRSADNTRIFHTPDCYNYDKITIKPGTTDRWFCSEQEALTAGFKKSQDCPLK